MPVGRVTSLYVYPLSFIEFLWAMEHDTLAEEMAEPRSNSLSEVVHTRLLELVGNYIAFGGMPEAVKTWQETKNQALCATVHHTIIDAYRQDFAKYAKKFQIKYVSILFKNAPLQLGRQYKYSDIEGEYRKRELAPSLDLLETAGIIIKFIIRVAMGFLLVPKLIPVDLKLSF